MSDGGFVFILSPIRIDAPLPFDISPDYQIDRAADPQVETIKQLLGQFGTSLLPTSPYENETIAARGDRAGQVSYRHVELPKDQWRYYVVNFRHPGALLSLEQACAVLPNELALGFNCTGKARNRFCWHAQSHHTFFNELHLEAMIARCISQSELDLLAEVFSGLHLVPEEKRHIERAYARFGDLKNIPRHSELSVLGMFSVIESILTHAPRPGDSSDSLSHQLRKKIPLVRKRCERFPDHCDPFGTISEPNLWKKLYDYRSAIIHGEEARMTGHLGALGTRERTCGFVREVAKALLIQSLREPELISDLKEC